ncbi:MAG: PEP-CTERM sorting domain-containing protein [Candidatus Omnitrophica bacterium]|nr:PEP-CTERM sorting domain-containing protein [Candidatus Omnitrophota bacterium]
MAINKLSLTLIAAAIVLLCSPLKAQALTFDGTGPWGDYTGSFTYSDISATSAKLTIDLKNTSPLANGGDLTAFAFNNPNNDITGASLSASDTNFTVIGGSSFNNGINASPYGQFDIGASTGGSFQGSGSPSKGLGVGQTGNFVFSLTGTNLNTLSENLFFNELSTGTGAGIGYQSMVVRFRGFQNGQSDKVPASVAPEPPSLVLLVLALFVSGIFFRKKLKVA